jgi:hypothetical protein
MGPYRRGQNLALIRFRREMAEYVKQTLRRHRIACISQDFPRRDALQYATPSHPQTAYVIGILTASSIALHKV